jgi:hypothetical protein
MQHPFFNESLAKQRIQILQYEAEMERAASSLAADRDEKDRTWIITRIFGLACFGAGLLIGSLLMRLCGLLPIVIMAGCICIFGTLPVVAKTWLLLKKPGVKAQTYKLTNEAG